MKRLLREFKPPAFSRNAEKWMLAAAKPKRKAVFFVLFELRRHTENTYYPISIAADALTANNHKAYADKATTHDGHAAAQCRCGPGDDPGPLGPLSDQDHATLLPSVQSQSPTGLSKGDYQGDGATFPVRKDLTKKKKYKR
jgi:hypothetical protein